MKVNILPPKLFNNLTIAASIYGAVRLYYQRGDEGVVPILMSLIPATESLIFEFSKWRKPPRAVFHAFTILAALWGTTHLFARGDETYSFVLVGVIFVDAVVYEVTRRQHLGRGKAIVPDPQTEELGRKWRERRELERKQRRDAT